MKKTIVLSGLFFLTSCHISQTKEDSYIKSDYITIHNSTINQTMKQDIYDKLYEIYQIKRETINEHIRSSVFLICKDDAYKPLDSILLKYNININITEPIAPSVYINNKYIYWEGDLNSTSSIIEVINPECDLCQIVSQRTKKLYDNLKSNIKIGYIIYSNESSLSEQALLFATKKHKFKELFNEFILSSNQLDTTTILYNMKKHNLDISQFYKNLAIIKEECLNRNIYLREQGISKTPTILINNKLVHNPLDTNYIKKRLLSSE